MTGPPPAAGAAGVTAVVVSYNSARHLAELHDALMSGSLAPERLLVVDNASSDDSAAAAAAAGFEVRETGANDGFGAACNVALGMCDSELMLICNPDVRPSRTALEQLVAALAENPKAAVAGAVFNRRLRARRFSRLSGDVYRFLPFPLQHRLRRLDSEAPVRRSDGPVAVDYVIGAFMLCRAGALREVDGFDESFFLYSEEEDLCRRLGGRGWQTLLVPSVVVGHGRSASSEGVERASMTPFRFHSLYLYYRKHHSRAYAELARLTLAACITLDRRFRALTHREQLYDSSAAKAMFWSLDRVRQDHERRRAGASPAAESS